MDDMPMKRRNSHLKILLNSLVLGLLAPFLVPLATAEDRVLPEGNRPDDRRLAPLKDLNGYFPFTPSATKEAWNSRATNLRRRLRVSLGLWPMPKKHDLHAVIHGKMDLGDYTIEKVYFESMPGFFVTGSLYRPKDSSGKLPGVLSPHGHWAEGRFYDRGEAGAKADIASGAEERMSAARSPLQARCVQLARMGCVVFHYDMIGYADNRQVSYQVAHRFAKQRADMNGKDDWGLFSPRAESHAHSVMGLQTFNSIRALDFLESLEDVDPKRLGVTGASGGGTQSFILAALDPRPAVAAPAVMVSTAMQGGCTCENACGLRVAAGNVEFAALFAPKPLLLTAANDWTREMTTKGFPQLKKHYTTMGSPDHVELMSAVQFGHNYNYLSRKAMYHWFNRHLQLELKEPIGERDFKRLSSEQLTVWNADHPAPKGGPAFERKLLRHWAKDTQQQLASVEVKSTLR